MITPGQVAGLVQRFDPASDGEAAKSKEMILALLASSAAPFSRRQFNPGHITCTGLVLSPDQDRILLVLHRRLKRWLLPGGHVEPDDRLIGDAARREVVEETGAILRADAAPRLAGVDVHGIPPRPDEVFHLHHDLIFRFQADSDACGPSEEAREVAWCGMAEFDRYQLPGSVRRSYARATAAASAVAGQDAELTKMAMGYFRSRALGAAARLEAADALGGEERTVAQLAAACGADPGALYRLLRALASFGVVAETRPASFVLTPFGQPLRKDAPDSAWAGVVFWADLLADSWSYLTECVRTGRNAAAVRPAGIPSRWSQDPGADAVFRAVMGTSPAEDYMPIARAWDFSKHQTVADLGGGGGALIAAILEAFPNVRGMLVDRPESIERAAARFESGRLAGRCKLVAGDLTKEVPPGAAVYMLKHVLHGYEDEAAAEILRHCRSVLPAEGRLLVVELVLPEVVDHADLELERRLMSDLNMLAVTGGRERSAPEWKRLLAGAGLKCERIIPVPGDLASIIEAAQV